MRRLSWTFSPLSRHVSARETTAALFLRFGREEQWISLALAELGGLLGLRIRYILGIDRDHTGTAPVRGHHHIIGLILIHVGHCLEHDDGEFARRIVVIEQDDLPKFWPLRLRPYLGFRFDNGVVAHDDLPQTIIRRAEQRSVFCAPRAMCGPDRRQRWQGSPYRAMNWKMRAIAGGCIRSALTMCLLSAMPARANDSAEIDLLVPTDRK